MENFFIYYYHIHLSWSTSIKSPQLVQEAYDILSDESKKRFYDQGLDKEAIEERVQQNQRFGGGGGGFSHFGGGFGGGGFGFR